MSDKAKKIQSEKTASDVLFGKWIVGTPAQWGVVLVISIFAGVGSFFGSSYAESQSEVTKPSMAEKFVNYVNEDGVSYDKWKAGRNAEADLAPAFRKAVPGLHVLTIVSGCLVTVSLIMLIVSAVYWGKLKAESIATEGKAST